MKLLFYAAFVVLLFSSASYPDDKAEPSGIQTLEMFDELNGKTELTGLKIFIDEGQNFVCGEKYSLFVLGESDDPNAALMKFLHDPVHSAAVQTGYSYLACRSKDLFQFPSGAMALPIGGKAADYVKFRVVSQLTNDGKAIGAVIEYERSAPNDYGLPGFGSRVLDINNGFDFPYWELSLEMSTDDFEYNLVDPYHYFDIRKGSKKLYFIPKLGNSGDVSLWLRIRESYTKVYLRTRRSL